MRYSTKELSRRTWPDFERLFSQGNGWDFCWCMHFHRVRFAAGKKIRAERSVINHRDKRALVNEHRSHGILVYAAGEPVGWCQYGPREELPRIDRSPNYLAYFPSLEREKVWRITCLVVDKKFRRRGVATAALKAALESIRNKGGGLVEACPVMDWEDLRASERHRRGHVPSFGNVSTCGTVSMFKKQDFKAVGPFGQLNVLMRRSV